MLQSRLADIAVVAAAALTTAAALTYTVARGRKRRKEQYTLYSVQGSGSLVVEAALLKAGAIFTIEPVDYSKCSDASFLAINPRGQVPALILPDGTTLMTESAAVCIHLALAYPDAKLAPPLGTAMHASFLRWMVYMSANLYETARRTYYADRFTSDASAAAAAAIRQKAASTHLELLLLVESQLSTRFLCGDDLCIADVYMCMLLGWGVHMSAEVSMPCVAEAVDSNRLPKLVAIREAVRADAVYGAVCEAHGVFSRTIEWEAA